ncbi:MAG: hypothetical protein IJV65_08990 [Kiritimatiellae bacterium]|nr:hypothetical protein [Kiritimatiellia bacterium]
MEPFRKTSSAANKLLSAGCLAAAGFAAVRMLWHSFTVARFAAEGWSRSLLFALVAALLVLGPGLAVLRLERQKLSFSDSVLKVLATGLASSGLVLWSLLLAGALTDATVGAWLVLCGVGLAAAAADVLKRPFGSVRRIAAAARADWMDASAAGRIGFAVCALFLCGCFENAAGRPFESWDSLVSWDKWAVDFAGRRALGGYLTGGYALFFPLVHSVFYRMAGSAGTVLPLEQLLLHGFCCVYPAILVLALRSAGRRFGFSGFAAFVFFAAGNYIAGDFAIGQVDIPLVAMAAAAVALAGRGGGARFGGFFSATALFFAVAFMKGSGLPWAAAAAFVCARDGRDRPRRTWIPFAAALAAALPFFALQLRLALRPELVDPSPFLLVLPFKFAHAERIVPGFGLVRLWVARAAFDRALPGGAASWFTAAAALALAVGGVAVRKTRGIAVFALAAMLFWFFTASYDLRNAEPALCLFSAVAAKTLRRARLRAAGGNAASRTAFAVLAACWTVLAVPGFCMVFANRCAVFSRKPGTVALRFSEPEGRRRLFKLSADLVNVLGRAPYGTHAAHVLSGDRLYRLFGSRGVCIRQLNGLHGLQSGDILLRAPSWMLPAPEPFRLAAALERSIPYHELWIACGDADFSDVPFSAGGGVLSVEGAPPCGMLELVFPDRTSASGATAISCANETAEAALFAQYVLPVRDGNVVRFLYWTGDSAPPRFAYAGPEPVAVRLWTPGPRQTP